jgi:hypothetical protein
MRGHSPGRRRHRVIIRHCHIPEPDVQIRPTSLTAALAGAFAAVAWPFLVDRFGGVGSGASLELVLATIFVIALPAHAFVVGFSRQPQGPGAGVDRALLKRVAAWLAAGIGIIALRWAVDL